MTHDNQVDDLPVGVLLNEDGSLAGVEPDENVWEAATVGFTTGSTTSRALHWAVAVPGGLLAALAVSLTGPPEQAHLAWVALALFVPVLTLIDAETMYLPNRLVYPTIVLVVLGALAGTVATGNWAGLAVALGCAVASFAYHFGIWFFCPPGSLGFGDVRLSFAIALALGLSGFTVAGVGAIVVPPLLAVVHALAVAARRQTKGDEGPVAVAFGPSMVLGSLLVMFFHTHLPAFF